MPKHSNYFEEAMELCRDSDPIVSRIAKSLYENMLSEYQQRGITPHSDFNMLLFYHVVIAAYLRRINSASRQDTNLVFQKYSLEEMKVPSSVKGIKPITHDCINLIHELTVKDGDGFDVEYAARIVELSFDDQSQPISKDLDIIEDPELYDAWLSGFNK